MANERFVTVASPHSGTLRSTKPMLEGMLDPSSDAEAVLDEELFFDDAAETELPPDGAPSMIFARRRPPSPAPREGDVLVGKYRVERIPGRRGLGIVLDVRHLELGRELTLKYLVPDACLYPQYVNRFMREVRSAVRIEGEHVARVMDVGRLDSGAPYMVRELLRGPDLADVLKVRGALPISEAVDYVIQACEGVAEGHMLGLVHGNLRPDTLFVTRRSDRTALVKVVDFGASDALHADPFAEGGVHLVGSSAILASVPYLASEQIRDPHDVDERADVYALGAILHELLTGARVFAGSSVPALLAAVVADPAPSVRERRADTPLGLDAVCRRCLQKAREARYQSLADLVLGLQPFASRESALSIQRVLRLARHPSLEPGTRAAQAEPDRTAAASASEVPPTQTQRLASPAPMPTINVEVAATVVEAPVAVTPSIGSRPEAPPHRAPAPSQTEPTILPPSRSSVPGGLARSWAPEPSSHRAWYRVVAIGVVAACGLLGLVSLTRSIRKPVVAVAPARRGPVAAVAAPAALSLPPHGAVSVEAPPALPLPSSPAKPTAVAAPAPVERHDLRPRGNARAPAPAEPVPAAPASIAATATAPAPAPGIPLPVAPKRSLFSDPN